MITLAVFQHHQAEGLGRIAHWASANHIKLVPFLVTESLPQSLDVFDGLIVLGGPMNVSDSPIWMQAEAKLIQQQLAQNKPILAICLGAQLLATELGAKIVDMPTPELGWHEVTFDNKQQLTVPQWHYQAIELPENLTAIASSTMCATQMFTLPNIVGLQFHPEWDHLQMQILKAHFEEECPFNTRHPHTLEQTKITTWFYPLLNNLFIK